MVLIIIVNNGVKAFNMPVKLLLICVSAFVNKKAGIKLPKTPINTKPGKYFLNSILECFRSKGDKNKKAIEMRMAATSSLGKQTKPLFIKIKELPQVSDSAIKIIQLNVLFCFKARQK